MPTDPDAVDADALDAARRALYRLPPEQFLAARGELVAATDDAPLAAAVQALRKPTAPAWIVNAFAAAEPDRVAELLDIGSRLAQAQAELDTATMRELTVLRRSVVAAVTQAALDCAGRADAGTTLREQVSSTFDAALADPSVAARLGALQRPESWSGFGVAPSAAAALTLVRSRRADDAATPDAGTPDDGAPADEPDDVAPDDDDLVAAREALEQASADAEQARAAEEELQARLRRLTTRLATVQNEISAVRADLDRARAGVTTARRARRTAQADVDRLERRR